MINSEHNTPYPTIPPDRIKGIIQYPCCPKQTAVVSKDAHGQASVQCANCKRLILLDYDKMTASITKPCKGVAARFKNAG